jgi:hypothetical protein
MILNRIYYNKISTLKSWWFRQQMEKLKSERLFKAFRLLKTEWPEKVYFYSPRLKKVPRFIGSPEKLAAWSGAQNFPAVCPTNAISVTKKEIVIDERGCIACGLCVEMAPEGMLEMPELVIPGTAPKV